MNLDENYDLTGELLRIFKIPSPVLKKKSIAIDCINDDLKSLIKNMLYTMYQTPGIGLAAPQVGVSKRLFIIDINFTREKLTDSNGLHSYEYHDFCPRIFINPVITKKEGTFLYEEGCLSIPGIYEEVKRSKKIELSYQDINGNEKLLIADEMLAVCIQHELDHLDGIIFLDHLSLLKRQMIQKKFLKKKNK